MTDDTQRAMSGLIEAAEQTLGLPVLAAGVFSRPGSMANVALAQVSPLAALLRGRAAKRRAGGLPPNVLLAVTGAYVHALSYKPGWGGVRAPQELARWARRGLRVEGVERGLLASRVTLVAGDERIELDVNAGDRKGINRAVLDVLRHEVAA